MMVFVNLENNNCCCITANFWMWVKCRYDKWPGIGWWHHCHFVLPETHKGRSLDMLSHEALVIVISILSYILDTQQLTTSRNFHHFSHDYGIAWIKVVLNQTFTKQIKNRHVYCQSLPTHSLHGGETCFSVEENHLRKEGKTLTWKLYNAHNEKGLVVYRLIISRKGFVCHPGCSHTSASLHGYWL